MVVEAEGDLLREISPWGVLLHQVNCMGIAGAGIAKEFRERFPGWYDEYRKSCEAEIDKRALIGRTHMFRARPDLLICSAFAQYDISKRRRATDYKAWKTILPALRRQFEEINAEGYGWEIRAPHGIGCGLGGGRWPVMRDLIEKEFAESPVKFILYRLRPEKRRSGTGRDFMEDRRHGK